MLRIEQSTNQPITTIAMADIASTQPATSDDRARIAGAFEEASGEIMGLSGNERDGCDERQTDGQTSETIDRNRAIGSTHRIKSVRVSDR